MEPHVDIAFDCLPLRSVGRVDVPLDASPAFRARCQQLQHAIDTHGTSDAYFLYNTRCVFRLANSDIDNMLRFSFDGHRADRPQRLQGGPSRANDRIGQPRRAARCPLPRWIGFAASSSEPC